MATILSISIPADLRKTLDQEAKRQRRSRSFVVAEAVREYVVRQQTLREGLALSPAERVSLTEELWQELSFGQKPARGRARSFETFDDYHAWRRAGGASAK